ncbi:MAG: hypothetical protein J6R77_04595, partial [Clostridia bacterium]|nr:hypothetical protein [Clostridia bacterium]
MSTIRFDAAAPNGGLLRVINEVPVVEKGGRAVLDPEKEILFALDADALPKGNEFTVAITYYDEVSNFASFAYPTVG